jgi:hypothetical protein
MVKVSTCEEPDDKCGTVPHFPLGLPTAEWFPEQIMAYAQVQYQVILDAERALAVNYWRLGKAMEALRKTFGHGHWEQFLKTSNLDKSKVFRARAIARTFGQEDDLTGLTVQQAYNHRMRKHRESTVSAAVDTTAGVARFTQFLEHVGRLTESFVDAAGFDTAGEAATLLPMVEQVLGQFQMIRNLLLKQIGSETSAQDAITPD